MDLPTRPAPTRNQGDLSSMDRSTNTLAALAASVLVERSIELRSPWFRVGAGRVGRAIVRPADQGKALDGIPIRLVSSDHEADCRHRSQRGCGRPGRGAPREGLPGDSAAL